MKTLPVVYALLAGVMLVAPLRAEPDEKLAAPVLNPPPRTQPSAVLAYDFGAITGAVIDESIVTETVHVAAEADAETGTGSEASPFKTIAAALQAAVSRLEEGKPTRIRVAPGIYREGGLVLDGARSPAIRDTLLVIEAEKPGTTILTGAEPLSSSDWRPVPDPNGEVSHYEHPWPYKLGFYPGPWKQHNARLASEHRRELLIVNGVPQQQILLERYDYDGKATQGENEEASGAPREVAKFGKYTYTGTLDPAAALTPGSFGVIERDADPAKRRLAWRPAKGIDVGKAVVEAGARDQILQVLNKSNLVLRGLVFRHSTGAIGRPAAVAFGKDWPQEFGIRNVLIENCDFLQNSGNQLGLFYVEGLTLRNSRVNYGAYGGVFLWGGRNILWEDNETSFNNWRMRGGWAAGALKAHASDGFVIRRHTSLGNFSHGLWFDVEVENVLVEGAVLVGNLIGIDWEICGHLLVRDSVIANNMGSAIAVLSAKDVVVENSVLAGYAAVGQISFEARHRMIDPRYSLRRILGRPQTTFHLDRVELRDTLVAVSPQPDFGQNTEKHYTGKTAPGFLAPLFLHHIGSIDYYEEFLRKGLVLENVWWSSPEPGTAFGLKMIYGPDWGPMRPINEWTDHAGFAAITGTGDGSRMTDPRFVDPLRNDFTFRPDSPLIGTKLPQWKLSVEKAREWAAHQGAVYMRGPRSLVSGFIEK